MRAYISNYCETTRNICNHVCTRAHPYIHVGDHESTMSVAYIPIFAHAHASTWTQGWTHAHIHIMRE